VLEDVSSASCSAAGAIGVLYKENASISGAEVGCQARWLGLLDGASLCEVLGGTPSQVDKERRAEIGMEHTSADL